MSKTNIRSMKNKDLALNFIRTTFTRKECTKYYVDRHRCRLVGYEVCRCGETKELHRHDQPSSCSLLEQKGKELQNDGEKIKDRKEPKFENKFAIKVIHPRKNNSFPMTSIGEKSESEQLLERPTVLREDDDYNDEKDEVNEEKEEEEEVKEDEEKEEEEGDKEFSRGSSLNNFSIKEKEENIKENIKEFPTNAYGSIKFSNESLGSCKPAKYVRLSDSSKLESVVALLTDYWKLLESNRPSLVISVIGGAKNFRLDGKKKETFNSGLIRVVKSTHAWILTGGMNVGATKCVGEAVNEGQSFVKEQNRMVQEIKCIGIAPWGYVKSHDRLINDNLNDFKLVRYKTDETIERYKNISLNAFHTHFLLIDDGIRNRFSCADKFRTELQKHIQEPKFGLGIPAVLLTLEGGLSSVEECCMALKNNVPIVVVANTGRAADLLAYGVSKTVQTSSGDYKFRKDHTKQLLSRIIATMTELEPEQIKYCADTIIECCSKANLITIFDINSNDGMDKYILYALLKGGGTQTDLSKIGHLKLSLLWNRPDIAESHIFPTHPVWPTGSLEDLMTSALLEEKIEFVKLMTANGLDMVEYLTAQRLRELYHASFPIKSYSSNSQLANLLNKFTKSSQFFLIHVHLLIQSLAKKHYDPIYMADTPQKYSENPYINGNFEDPYQELLLWAILSNRGNLALYFWERCNFPLVSAIVATCVYKSLWGSIKAKDTELRLEYTKRKDIFEKLAVEYLDKCYKLDCNDAIGILEQRHEKWGNMDCLEIAHAANDLILISTPCCQASINKTWRRGMMSASTVSVFIANICPLLVWTGLFRFQKLEVTGRELTPFQKLTAFYKSPISKFYSHSLFLVLFLVLYAYVVLLDFRPEMSASEKLLLVWMLTFFIEEVRELLNEDAFGFRAKLRDWLSSIWKRFYLISFFLALIAFGLRLHHSTFKWGRITYAVNTNIFYIRFFRIYHINYKLGPKLVIFYRMISEVFVFMSLLLIFILGYGIASQALLHPWRSFQNTNLTTIIHDVILVPYWQIYGELQLDKMEGVDNNQCEVSSTWGVEVCENPNEYTWVVSLMLVFFLIIGNIMLLNLLIAVFTYVFHEVHENSMEIWKFEMYRLMREYEKKPGIIPPFAILDYIYRLIKFVWIKYYGRPIVNSVDESYMRETLRSLLIFEKKSMTSYLTEAKERKEASLDSIVLKIGEKIDKISKYIDQEEEIKEIEELEWFKENQLEENPVNEGQKSKPNNERGTSNNKKMINAKLSSTDDDDGGMEEEKNEDDIDWEFYHPENQKIYMEGFSSLQLPIPRSIPSQSVVLYPRQAAMFQSHTEHQHSLRNQMMIREQQTQLDTITSTINVLVTHLEKSRSEIELKMTTILQMLEKLQIQMDEKKVK